jgi:hypothetical protein
VDLNSVDDRRGDEKLVFNVDEMVRQLDRCLVSNLGRKSNQRIDSHLI